VVSAFPDHLGLDTSQWVQPDLASLARVALYPEVFRSVAGADIQGAAAQATERLGSVTMAG